MLSIHLSHYGSLNFMRTPDGYEILDARNRIIGRLPAHLREQDLNQIFRVLDEFYRIGLETGDTKRLHQIQSALGVPTIYQTKLK